MSASRNDDPGHYVCRDARLGRYLCCAAGNGPYCWDPIILHSDDRNPDMRGWSIEAPQVDTGDSIHDARAGGDP